MAKGIYLQNALNNYVLDATAFTPAGTLYGALCTASVTGGMNGATITEISYTSYARVAITNDGSVFGASAAGLIQNSAAIAWPAPTGNGNAPIVSVAILDGNAGTSADDLYYYDDVSSLSILNGDNAPSIEIGDFDHQEG